MVQQISGTVAFLHAGASAAARTLRKSAHVMHPCFEAIDRPCQFNVCWRLKSGSSNQTQLGPLMTQTGR